MPPQKPQTTSDQDPAPTPVVVPLGVGDGVFDGEGVCDDDRVPEGVSARGVGVGNGNTRSAHQSAEQPDYGNPPPTPAQSHARKQRRPVRGVTHMSKTRCRRRFHWAWVSDCSCPTAMLSWRVKRRH
jgi:hypothetical protein